MKLRRRGASWCSGYTEVTLGTRSAAGFDIYAVTASLDPATGRLERVAWAENDPAGARSRLWTRDPGTGGKLDAGDAPAR